MLLSYSFQRDLMRKKQEMKRATPGQFMPGILTMIYISKFLLIIKRRKFEGFAIKALLLIGVKRNLFSRKMK